MRQRYDRELGEIAKLFEGTGDDGISMEEIEAALKKVDDEPRTLEEMLADRRIHEIDSALDTRASAFMSTTFEIVLSDEDDKEALILRAVEDFAAMMAEDVPRLFSGELSKQLVSKLTKFTAEGASVPSLRDVQQCVAKLLPSGGDGGTNVAKLFEKLNEDDSTALAKLREENEAGKVALAKVAELEEAVAKLEADPGEGGDDVHPLCKGMTKGQRELVGPIIEHFEKQFKKQADDAQEVRENFGKREKAARRLVLVEFAKGLEGVSTDQDELVEMLEKAEAAGCLETLQKTLTAAGEAASLALGPVGSDNDGLVVKGGAANDAFERVTKRAAEIRKGHETEMTPEGAYIAAEKEMPDEAALAAGITVN